MTEIHHKVFCAQLVQENENRNENDEKKGGGNDENGPKYKPVNDITNAPVNDITNAPFIFQSCCIGSCLYSPPSPLFPISKLKPRFKRILIQQYPNHLKMADNIALISSKKGTWS